MLSKRVRPPESLRKTYRTLKLALEATYNTQVREKEDYYIVIGPHYYGTLFYILDPKKVKLRISYVLSDEVRIRISPIPAAFQALKPEGETWDFFEGPIEPVDISIPTKKTKLMIPPKYCRGHRIPGVLILSEEHPSLNVLSVVVLGGTPEGIPFVASCSFYTKEYIVKINEIFIGMPLDTFMRILFFRGHR